MLGLAGIHLLVITSDMTEWEEMCRSILLSGATVVPRIHKIKRDQAACASILQTTAS